MTLKTNPATRDPRMLSTIMERPTCTVAEGARFLGATPAETREQMMDGTIASCFMGGQLKIQTAPLLESLGFRCRLGVDGKLECVPSDFPEG